MILRVAVLAELRLMSDGQADGLSIAAHTATSHGKNRSTQKDPL